jgi:hypothetical protein
MDRPVVGKTEEDVDAHALCDTDDPVESQNTIWSRVDFYRAIAVENSNPYAFLRNLRDLSVNQTPIHSPREAIALTSLKAQVLTTLIPREA